MTRRPYKNKWQQHDRVRWAGVDGVVITTSAPNPEVPLQVLFPQHKLVVGFSSDGRFLPWHSSPSLEFISRPGSSLFEKIKKLFSKKEKTK